MSDTVRLIDEKARANKEVFEVIASETLHQIARDTEPPLRVGRDLWAAYKANPSATDDVLVALCGWEMESILEFAGLTSSGNHMVS